MQFTTPVLAMPLVLKTPVIKTVPWKVFLGRTCCLNKFCYNFTTGIVPAL